MSPTALRSPANAIVVPSGEKDGDSGSGEKAEKSEKKESTVEKKAAEA